MEWDGIDIQIGGIFNQPLENYSARNGFVNCYCAAIEVNYNENKRAA